MTDVLDRLRASNPVRDMRAVGVETPSPGIPAPRTRRRRRGWRPAFRVVGFIAVLAALVLGISVPGRQESPPSGTGNLDTAAAVAATLDPGGFILHVKTRTSQVGPEGQETSWETDVWLVPGGQRGHIRTRFADGRILSLPVADEHTLDPVGATRAMLREGDLRQDRTTVLNRREVKVFTARGGETTLYADAESLHPVRTILRRGRGPKAFTSVTDFRAINRLQDTPENRRRLDLPESLNGPSNGK